MHILLSAEPPQWEGSNTLMQCLTRLSLTAALGRGGLMTMQAEGWRMAEKDRIDLDCARLRDAQGLITCPPASVGHKPFHCCLQVREEAHVLHQVRRRCIIVHARVHIDR